MRWETIEDAKTQNCHVSTCMNDIVLAYALRLAAGSIGLV